MKEFFLSINFLEYKKVNAASSILDNAYLPILIKITRDFEEDS